MCSSSLIVYAWCIAWCNVRMQFAHFAATSVRLLSAKLQALAVTAVDCSNLCYKTFISDILEQLRTDALFRHECSQFYSVGTFDRGLSIPR